MTASRRFPKQKIDVAFFPVDPRQGSMYDAGAGYFIMTVKPKVFIPMHFQGRPDVALRFCRHRGNPADAHRRAGAARATTSIPASAGGRDLRAGSEAEGFIEGRRKIPDFIRADTKNASSLR